MNSSEGITYKKTETFGLKDGHRNSSERWRGSQRCSGCRKQNESSKKSNQSDSMCSGWFGGNAIKLANQPIDAQTTIEPIVEWILQPNGMT